MGEDRSRQAPREIAEALKKHQDRATQLDPLSSEIDGMDNAFAYSVAHIIHQMRVEAGAAPVGRKIGFTNANIWPTYGVYEPIWGYVYDTTIRHNVGETGTTVELGRFAEPRIEPEIVLRFDKVPTATDDPETLLSRIDWIAHGIEIVHSHYPGWKFRAADAIADSGLHGMLLVGKPMKVASPSQALMAQLEEFTVTLSRDGEVRDTGRGSNVLGGPLKAVAHLIPVVNSAPVPAPLAAGELVTTGTLTPAFPVHARQRWSTEIKGIDLPGLTVSFV